jgi:hypothetical protein
MSFLFPAFLIGGLAVAIPIVLHLLRREEAPEVPFSAVHLLRPSPVERSRRRRLRDLLLLAARVVALLLLAGSFARPYQAGVAPASAVVILAIDRSFSMGAPGAMERAQELARTVVREAGAARVAAIAFDESAEVIATPGAGGEALRAIEQVTPAFGATAYAPVVARAAEIAEGDPARLVIITDLQSAGWAKEHQVPAPSTLELDVRDVGAPVANLAVLDARVQPSRIVVTVRNTGTTPYSGSLRLSIDGTDVASATAAALPGATIDVPVHFRAPASGVLAVSADDPAGFPADNTRFALLDAATRSQVLVVAAPAGVRTHAEPASGFYVRRALEAGAGDEGAFESTTVASPGLTGLGREALSRYAVVVLLSTRGLDRAKRDALMSFVRAGGGLLVAAGPDVDARLLTGLVGGAAAIMEAGREGPSRVLAVTDLRHPIFRPFGPLTANLGQVRFERAWRMPVEGWSVAAAFTDGTPALLERTEGRGRVLLFTSDLDRRWNDFPLHPAFVPFVLEAGRHAAGRPAFRRDVPVGEAPAGMPRSPGVHSMPDGRRVVLNVDTRESALSRVTVAEFAGMLEPAAASPRQAVRIRAEQTEARQSFWQYGLMLMLAVLVAESAVGRASRS